MKKVAVFGSAKPVPGEPDYQNAQHLGELLAQHHFGVITGGYMGTMEAVSRGAAAFEGQVIGVTCAEIENWRPVGHNAWIQQVIHCQSLEERIRTMIVQADAGAIALPGGIGTLAEIAMFWNQINIDPQDARPLVLIGEGWQQTILAFQAAQKLHLPAQLPVTIHFSKSVDEALQWFCT